MQTKYGWSEYFYSYYYSKWDTSDKGSEVTLSDDDRVATRGSGNIYSYSYGGAVVETPIEGGGFH